MNADIAQFVRNNVGFGLLLCAIIILSASNSYGREYSYNKIRIVVNPYGEFAVIDSESELFGDFAKSAVPDDNILICTVLTRSDAGAMLKNGYASLDQYASIQIPKISLEASIDMDMFFELKTRFKNYFSGMSLVERFNPNGFGKISNYYSEKYREKVELKLDSAYQVNWLDGNSHYFGMVTLMKMIVYAKQMQTGFVQVAGTGIVNAGGTLIYLYVYKEYKSDSTFAEVNAIVRGWAEKLYEDNKDINRLAQENVQKPTGATKPKADIFGKMVGKALVAAIVAAVIYGVKTLKK